MKKEFASFDVFDSCLIRRCGASNKIWDLMADNLFKKEDIRGRLSFTGGRRLAESKASKKILCPTLKDIYQELNVSQWNLTPDSVMKFEMEQEEQELFPNQKLLDTVNQYRKNGYKIAFVSDMYLPTAFIKRILAKFGFFIDGDFIFVSGDCGCGKFDGKLFDYVFKATDTKAGQWIHFGDNERDDFQIPKSKGMSPTLIQNTAFTREEKRWIEEARFYPHKHEIELWAGLCRLTRLQNADSFAASMAIDFVASTYIPYVLYILRDAKSKGIKTLYFVARDGRIFLEIAKSMKAEFEGIECRYLKLSRKVLYSCAFYDVDDYELSLTIARDIYQTVEKTLQMIGVSYDSLSQTTKSKYERSFFLNTEKKALDFSACLMQNDAEIIKNASETKRELLLKYLRQEKFFDSNSALVDLGWSGSTRCILNHISRKEKYKPIPSFYWGYYKNLLFGQHDDEVFVFNKFFCLDNFPCANLFFEKYASSNESGSTIAYEDIDGTIVPIESKYDASSEKTANLNETLARCVAKNIPKSLQNKHDAFEEIFLVCGMKQMARILKYPTTKEISLFKDIEYENFGTKLKMIRRCPFKDMCALLVWGSPISMIWVEASLKKTFGPIAPLFKFLYQYTSQTLLAKKLRLWWETRN